MIAGQMVGWRNPARYLAPLAIAAAGTATYAIVHNALRHKHAAPPPVVVPSAVRPPTAHRAGGPTKPKFYVVRPDDTLSKIAVRTGVSLSILESLNPKVNPNALHPAQRLRLRR
jgi:LysM repeat protein